MIQEYQLRWAVYNNEYIAPPNTNGHNKYDK